MVKYGLQSKTLGDAAKLIGGALQVMFELHSSSYRGGDYYLSKVAEGKIIIQSNLDILDREPFESAWPANQLLLCFDGLDDEKWTRFTELLCPLEASGAIALIKRSHL